MFTHTQLWYSPYIYVNLTLYIVQGESDVERVNVTECRQFQDGKKLVRCLYDVLYFVCVCFCACGSVGMFLEGQNLGGCLYH